MNRLRLFRLRKNKTKHRKEEKKNRDKLIEEKFTEKRHYKQVFSRWTKTAMTSIQNGSHILS